jgi:glycosyltransferase involved in cell wall biosynthesis
VSASASPRDVRIAIDASALAKPAPGGIARYVRELVLALARRAGDPETFTLAYRLSRFGDRRHFLPPPSPRFRSRVFQEPLLFTLGRADVFHGPDARVPRGSRAALVATIHDLFSATTDAFADERFRRKKRERYADLVRRCALLLVPSSHVARGCVERLGADPSRVAVTPEGVSPEFHAPAAEAVQSVRDRLGIRGDYFLFVGEQSARKNVVRLVEAFAALRGRSSSLSLVLAGRPSFGHEAIAAAIARLGVDSGVVAPGFVAAADLPALYGGARALVFPSLDEGFGLPALEAMACGTPVVASSRGALPEVVGDAALLVRPESVDDLRNAMATLLEDATAAADLRARGFARAREFTWDRTAALTLDAYRRAAAAR